MLRASSLGLCLLPPAIRGPRPCFLIFESGLGPQARTSNPFSSSLRFLRTNNGGLKRGGPTAAACSQPGQRHRAALQTLEINGSVSPPPLPCLFPPPGSSTLIDVSQDSTSRNDTDGPHVNREKLHVRHFASKFRLREVRASRNHQKNKGSTVRQKSTRPKPRRACRPPPQSPLPPPPASHYITKPPPYPAGHPWRPAPIRPLSVRAPKKHAVSHFGLSADLERLRLSLLRTMAITPHAAEAWDAYSNLRLLAATAEAPRAGKLLVPLVHMHRLARLLARARPKTRTVFLRLLSVLGDIRAAGGTLRVHQWNALIDASAKGWRRMRMADLETALSLFRDMVGGYAPGTSLVEKDGPGAGEGGQPRGEPVEPDVYTYTILLHHAARTGQSSAIQHVSTMLRKSGLPPSRVTHLAQLTYFTHTNQLSGVRSTLYKMREQGFEVGLDGINALLWAYGHNKRIDVVMMIYRILRHNASPEMYVGEGDVASVALQLKQEEYIVIPAEIQPNQITFTTMVQVMAYQGNLLATLTVFMDMISSNNLEMGAPLELHEDGLLKPTTYSPTLPVFRAIFLGFTRHALGPTKHGKVPLHLRATNPPDQPHWTLENLQALFDTFLTLPGHTQISQQIVYWIMVAFRTTSAGDVELLRKVWMQLESRFDGPWGAPGSRLYQMRLELFPGETDVFELKRARNREKPPPPHLPST